MYVIQVRGKTPGDGGEDGWVHVAQRDVREGLPSRACLKLCLIPGTVLVQDMYHLFHPLYYPEIVTEHEIEI